MTSPKKRKRSEKPRRTRDLQAMAMTRAFLVGITRTMMATALNKFDDTKDLFVDNILQQGLGGNGKKEQPSLKTLK